jgi:hypothetical protein
MIPRHHIKGILLALVPLALVIIAVAQCRDRRAPTGEPPPLSYTARIGHAGEEGAMP